MLHATTRDSCRRTALQSPRPHDPPAFWPVLRHARDDASCTTASRELGAPTFSAWLMRRLISAARRLLSSPATRTHLGHSAQARVLGRFAELAHLLCTCSVRSRRSDTCRFAPCYPPPARRRSSFRLGSRWFDDASRAPSNHAPAARSGRTAWTGAG